MFKLPFFKCRNSKDHDCVFSQIAAWILSLVLILTFTSFTGDTTVYGGTKSELDGFSINDDMSFNEYGKNPIPGATLSGVAYDPAHKILVLDNADLTINNGISLENPNTEGYTIFFDGKCSVSAYEHYYSCLYSDHRVTVNFEGADSDSELALIIPDSRAANSCIGKNVNANYKSGILKMYHHSTFDGYALFSGDTASSDTRCGRLFIDDSALTPTVKYGNATDSLSDYDLNDGKKISGLAGGETGYSKFTQQPSGDIMYPRYVTVTEDASYSRPVTGVTIADIADTTIEKGESKTISAVVSGVSDKSTIWTSDDVNTVKVEPTTGKITGIAEGTANITVRAVKDLSVKKTFKVTVEDNIVVNAGEDISVVVGDTATVSANVEHDNLDQGVTWTSDNEDIVSVGAGSNKYSAVITAKKGGKATLTASSVTSPDKQDTIDVTVIDRIFKITLKPGEDGEALGLEPIIVKVPEASPGCGYCNYKFPLQLVDDESNTSTVSWEIPRKRLLYWVDKDGNQTIINRTYELHEDATFTGHWVNRFTNIYLYEDIDDYNDKKDQKHFDWPISYFYGDQTHDCSEEVTYFKFQLPQSYWDPCEYDYQEFRHYAHPVTNGGVVSYEEWAANSERELIARTEGEEGDNYFWAVWDSTWDHDPTNPNYTPTNPDPANPTNPSNTGTTSHNKVPGTCVKGEKVDLPKTVFTKTSGIGGYKIDSGGTGKGSVNKQGIFKGKRPGLVIVLAMDGKGKDAKEVDSVVMTVLNKPKFDKQKLKALTVGQKLDAYDLFATEDTKNTAADKWSSSKPSVATIDDNGNITIVGTGKTKITAEFGNVKVKGTIKVK